MYIISEYVVCVALMFTLSALLLGFSIVLLTVRQGVAILGRTSREIQHGGTRFLLRSAVRDARHKAVGG
jgi:hypothetical protein